MEKDKKIKREKTYSGEVTFDFNHIDKDHKIIDKVMKHATQISIRVNEIPRVLSEELDMTNGTILDIIPHKYRK